MAHITAFKIEGLAGRTEVFERVLDRHINIFFGLNGCGKTSLLKILNSAMDNDASTLGRVPFTSASVTIYSLQRKEELTYSLRKTETPEISSGSSEEAVFDETLRAYVPVRGRAKPLQWKLTSKTKPAKGGWHHRYLPTSRLLLGQFDPRHWAAHGPPSMSEDQIDMFFAESMKRLWIDYSSKLLGQITTAQQAGLASILKAVLSPRVRTRRKSNEGLNSHQAYERMRQFVIRQGSPTVLSSEEDFKKRFEVDSTLRRVVSDIDRIEGEIEQASAPRSKLKELIQSLFSGGKSISFSDQAIEVKTASGIDIWNSVALLR